MPQIAKTLDKNLASLKLQQLLGLCQLTVIASLRRPRRCVEHRKLNYQLILLAVVDA